MAGKDQPDNLFIRFKNHIDNNIHRGFHALLGPLATMETQDNSSASTHITLNQKENPSSSVADPMRGLDGTSDIFSWAIHSRYSPLNLQSLPQPHPNDAPRDYPNLFTFRDAFEDLLAVSAGQPLPDLRTLVFEKHIEHIRYFPLGVPVGDWVTGIGRRGLWGAYFNLSSAVSHEFSHGIMTPYDMLRLRTNKMVFRQPEAPAWPLDDFPSWGHLHLPMEWHHVWTNGVGSSNTEKEADTESDLYAATQSQFAVDSRARAGGPPGDKSGSTRNISSPGSEEVPISQTLDTPDGGKIVKIVQQHTHDGKAKFTTTTRQFDADGKLIAQGEETTRTWTWEFPGKASISSKTERSALGAKSTTSSPTNKADIHTTTQRDERFSGWFWTR